MTDRTRDKIQTLSLIATAVVLTWVLYRARWGLLLVYVSILVATGFLPLIRWIEHRRLPRRKHRIPRWQAVLAVYTAIVLGLAIVIAVVAGPVIAQGQLLVEQVPGMLERAQSFLEQRGLVPQGTSIANLVQQIPASAGSAALGTAGSVLGGIATAIVIFFLSLYLVLEWNRLRAFALSFVPAERRPQVASAVEQAVDKVGAWMLGQLFLCLIIGTTSGVALGLMGVPFFYVLSVIAGVGEFVPFVGPLIAAVPAVGVALTQSWQLAAGVVVFFFVQQQAENQVLVPKLMQHQVGMSPAFVMIAIIIGSALLGIVGAILAIPTAAIFQVAFREVRRGD